MMVSKSMFTQIMELKRQGKSRRYISRELRLDKKTVSKYYTMTDEEYRSMLAASLYREKVFDEYEELIMNVYSRNNYKKIPVSALYDYLEEQCGPLPGTEKTLRNYVRYLEGTGSLAFTSPQRQYQQVPELPPGKQLQLDFGQYRTRGGTTLYIFAAILSFSRYKYAVLQDRPFTTGDVITHLLNCFDHFGGIPEELVIDQDRLLVVSENSGDIIYTRDFGYFIEEMGLQMYVCRKADPESKGKVENTVKFVKSSFFPARDCATTVEWNESLSGWLGRRANGKICQATGQLAAVLFEQEQAYLQPLRNSIFRRESLAGREMRMVNDKCQISVHASQYGVPARYRNHRVEVYVTSKKLFIYDQYDGSEIAVYDLSPIPGKIVSKRAFRRVSERTSKDLKQEVRSLCDDDRWQRFVSLNFKTFQRYVRDQCLDALKYFSGEGINMDILLTAVDFCLENHTLSFANLHDTYTHFLYSSRQQNACQSEPAISFNVPTRSGSSLRVAQRSMAFYEDVANLKKEVAQ